MAYTPGISDSTAIISGYWNDVECTPLSGSAVKIGMVRECVAEFSQGYVEHMGNKIIQMPDLFIRVSAGIKLSMQFEEHNRRNWHLALGKSNADSTAYNYIGGTGERATVYHTVHMQRIRNDAGVMAVKVNKGAVSGNVTLGGSAAPSVVTAPVVFTAVDDEAAVYGGSATSPLGWAWFPTGA